MKGAKPNSRGNKTKKPVLEDSRGGEEKLETISEETGFELWDSRFIIRGDQDPDISFKQARWDPCGWCKPSCIPITIILVLIVLVVLLPLLDQSEQHDGPSKQGPPVPGCLGSCTFSLVESIPIGLKYDNGTTPHPSTYNTWLALIMKAQASIEIASFYWTLRSSEVYSDPSSYQGEQIFQELLRAGTERGLTVKIAQNLPSKRMPNLDTKLLAQKGAAEVRSVDFRHLMGGGVLHTKLWLIDRKHVYIGSANMDWRSLTQVKELGAVIYNCPCIAADIAKLFEVYWFLGQKEAKIPSYWPPNLSTTFNNNSPLNVSFNGSEVQAYVGSSPPAFCPDGRATDLSAILEVISTAENFIYIAVMDYLPLTVFSPEVKFWPFIDDALKAAAINNNVTVRLLISHWNSSRPAMTRFLKSLTDISDSLPGVNIEVKLFEVPSSPSQAKIPYARVNHNKYMVTDNTAYIGTSNWSGDYFIDTAGAGLVVKDLQSSHQLGKNSSIRLQLQAVFERDWNSEYSHILKIS